MRFTVHPSNQFKTDLKRMRKRGYDPDMLKEPIRLLADGKQLPPEYLDHPLTGNWSGCRECHIKPDWLLVYKRENDKLLLLLMRTGTHSDIFR